MHVVLIILAANSDLEDTAFLKATGRIYYVVKRKKNF